MELLIGDVFRNVGRVVPDRTATVVGPRSLTFGQVDRLANQMARVVAKHGLDRGDRVAVWAATNLDVVPLFAGLAKLGAVFAPMNPALSADEAVETAAAARPALLVVDEARVDAGAVASKVGASLIKLDQLVAAAEAEDDTDVVEPALSENDPHVIFFTSGSTGRPKGVVLTHRLNYLRTHPGGIFDPRGPMVCPFPLFHMAGWTISLQQWQARAPVVFVPPDAASICGAVEQHRATRVYGIPAVWRRVLEYLQTPEGAAHDLSTVKAADTGTSATPPALLDALRAALPGARVRVFYGSTEAGGVAALEHDDLDRKPGRCGQPSPFVHVRIDDSGELWVRGPFVFDRYFEDAAATAEAIVDGWYRTGDLAEFDDDGYLSIVGRARDVIRTGGETVAPAEVEAALTSCPGLADVAVVGVPDVEWGEVVCAVVVAADSNAPPSLDDLRAYCTGRLAAHKHPRRLAVLDAIPRTSPTNQVQRRLLVEMLSSRRWWWARASAVSHTCAPCGQLGSRWSASSGAIPRRRRRAPSDSRFRMH
jgi:acyl-CoA synthetase (AMP-forming)/AMP-acid ligase II